MTARTTYSSALSPEYALLGFLAQQPAHGYDLHLRLTAELGQVWHVSQSQVYNILNRLEAQGFIAATVQAQAKLPARRRLRLTSAGRQRFDQWLCATTGSSVRAIRVEFTTRLYFAYALDLALARRLLVEQAAETRAGLDRLTALLADLPSDQTFNRLGLELRIRQLESILVWLADCRRALGLNE
jgi:DNA-binding PadR family transcriptional regulator